MAAAKTKRSKTGIETNIEDLAKNFGLPDWDTLYEMNTEYIFDVARGAETDEEREKAEQEAGDELYRNWSNAVERAAEQILNARPPTRAPVLASRRDIPCSSRIRAV